MSSSPTIHDIPLDTWTRIMLFVNPNTLVETFDILYEANVFNIPDTERLNTFWIIIAQARHINISKDVFDVFPDAKSAKWAYSTLKDLGLNEAYAIELVRQTNANLQAAFTILGWD
jgi:hypothetical protein